MDPRTIKIPNLKNSLIKTMTKWKALLLMMTRYQMSTKFQEDMMMTQMKVVKNLKNKKRNKKENLKECEKNNSSSMKEISMFLNNNNKAVDLIDWKRNLKSKRKTILMKSMKTSNNKWEISKMKMIINQIKM